MIRPTVICHMVTSVDGGVTGDFLSRSECEQATDVYYGIHRRLKSDGFMCGRVTMEESFTHGHYPDLSQYEPVCHDIGLKMDYIVDDLHGFYAVAFDPHGRLGWESDIIADDDEGYDGAQVIEILTEQVDERYLGYLESMNIPYLFARKDEIDVALALFKLKTIIGCDTLLLEGGSILNGAFQRADMIDELSLVVAPLTADANSKPLFTNGTSQAFEPLDFQHIDGIPVWRYKRIR